MKEGWLDSTMQAINQRIKNPLWGFIILAWVWFNWPNLAMLFMSDAPVKFRIDYILSQEYFYPRYVLAPIFFGGILAIVTPYAQWLLSHAHKWATDKHRENIYLTREREYQDSIRLSGLKVQADRAIEKENAKIDADIKAEVERGKREELVTEELEIAKKEILSEISTLKQLLAIEKETISNVEVEKNRLQDFIVASLNIINQLFKIDSSRSIQQLKAEIEGLFTVSDIEASTIRNTLKSGGELTPELLARFFSFVDEQNKVKKSDVEGAGNLINKDN
ncbi:TPA: hypothetical protein SMI00_000085 [Serratia marcescens]|nr:hypothetical protein [Serratia marcescens]